MKNIHSAHRDQPLVSVVIPMYNAAAYLRECIDSVIAQSYPHLEIIAVDDGSPDNGADIVRGYLDARREAIAEVGAWVARLMRRKTVSRQVLLPPERPVTA